MIESGFGALDHVPYVLVAEVKGENGTALLSLGDDVDVARLSIVTPHPSLTVGPKAMRTLAIALIEGAGRLEQRATQPSAIG